MTPLHASYAAWIVFLVGWTLSAFWTGRARARAAGSGLAHIPAYQLGFLLLFAGDARGFMASLGPAGLHAPLWRTPMVAGWLLLAVQIAAFAFACWARVHMGRLWSGFVTVRDDHRIVDTGPFALVRHPIYTGFIAATLALAAIKATPTAWVGALLIVTALFLKARVEEGFLRRELGAGAYDAYAARTPMLAPFAPR